MSSAFLAAIPTNDLLAKSRRIVIGVIIPYYEVVNLRLLYASEYYFSDPIFSFWTEFCSKT